MSLRRNVVSVFGINLLGKLFNAVTLVLIIRLYGEDLLGYAAYTNAHAVFSFTVGFVFSAFNTGLVRYGGQAYYETGERPLHLYHAYLALQVIAYAALLAVAALLPVSLSRALFGDPGYQSALVLGLVAGSGMLLANWLLHVLQTEERFVWYNQLNFWRQALLLPGVAALAWLGEKNLLAVMAVFWAANFLPAAVVLVRLRLFGLLRLWEAPRALLRQQVVVVGLLVLFYSIHTVFDQIGIFMLGHFSTPEEVARFGVVFRYYGAAMLLVVSLNAILLPRFTQALLGDRRAQRQFFFQWLKWTLPGILPIAGLLYLSQPIWVALNTQEYADLYPAAVVLGAGVYISLLGLPAFSALIGQSRYRNMLLYLVVCLGGYIAWGAYALPETGAEGAALITAVVANGVYYTLLVLDAFVWPRKPAPVHA